MRKKLAAGLAQFNASAKKLAPDVFQVILFMGGLGMVAYSGWMVYHPLGIFLGGIFAVKVSFILADG